MSQRKVMGDPVEPSGNYVAPYTEADCQMLATAYASDGRRKQANGAVVRRLLATVNALRAELRMEEYRTNDQIRDKHRILVEYEEARNAERARADVAEAKPRPRR